jgi:hypothetical protein
MVSKRFSKVGDLRNKLVQFSCFLEIWIIIYELITNYPRLIIKLELIIKQNYFIILFQRLNLNSNYRIEIILIDHVLEVGVVGVKQLELNVIIQPVQEHILFLLVHVDVVRGIP